MTLTRPPASPARTTTGLVVAALAGFAVGAAGALGQDVDLPRRAAGDGVVLPTGMVVVVLLGGLTMLCVVAATRSPWPRFALLAGWLVAVGVAGSGGPGSDLILRQDTRGVVFLVASAVVMATVALLVPRWLR